MLLDLTAERARELFCYDPATGVLTWKVERRAGQRAGATMSNGYRGVRIGGGYSNTRYLEHRIVWLLVCGEWPKGDIDHVNGDRSDNRLCNLRQATRSQNCCNVRMSSANTSGFRGVSRTAKKWRAQIRINGQRHHLGLFHTAEEASLAYRKASVELHGIYGTGDRPARPKTEPTPAPKPKPPETLPENWRSLTTITVGQAALALGIDRDEADAAASANHLPVLKLGGRTPRSWRVPVQRLIRLMEAAA